MAKINANYEAVYILQPDLSEDVYKRQMVRQPNNKGNAGSATNGMPPTSSMGCGTWGGNIVSENIALKHYMNKMCIRDSYNGLYRCLDTCTAFLFCVGKARYE